MHHVLIICCHVLAIDAAILNSMFNIQRQHNAFMSLHATAYDTAPYSLLSMLLVLSSAVYEKLLKASTA